MDNGKKLAALGTQNEDKQSKNRRQRTKEMSNTNPTIYIPGSQVR